MGIPTFTCEVAFAANPLDTAPVFTDLAADMESLTIKRGRQTEDDAAQTGTAVAVLVDDVSKYDPNNPAGIYYPNVQPMKPLRIRATLSATTYQQFYGWIDVQDGWVRDESEPGRASVSLPANDGFEILTNGQVVTAGVDTGFLGHSFPQEDTGSRIVEVLAHIGTGFALNPTWPAAWEDIDTGLETMQAFVATAGTDPLTLIRDAETTEPGFFFFDGRGFACFRNRRSRLTATSVATFCDTKNYSAGRILYESVTTRRTLVVNDALVTRNGGTLQEASDSTSILQRGRRAKSYSTQHLDDPSALKMAQWVLSLKKDTYETLESLTLTPGTDDATWVQLLTRELGDRITIVRTPPGASTPVTKDYFIEGLSITFGPGATGSCTWRLSPADQVAYWLAGTVGHSEAGTTTKAAY